MLLGLTPWELEAKIDTFIVRQDLRYACTICGKTVRDKAAARNHIEALHIPSAGHTCTICGKMVKTKNALYIHISRVHKN